MSDLKELENEISVLKKENEQLKNRCIVLSHGMMCLFCPSECKHRTTEFRGDVTSNE